MATDSDIPLPRADEASLADLVPSLLSALDVPGFGNPLGIEPTSRACLLLVDGLGWELFQANREFTPFLNAGARDVRPLTTGFPATTVASLGSIGTGRPPGEHGLVGTTLAVPGGNQVMSCLRWVTYGAERKTDLRDQVVPERFQPDPTVFERAADDRVEVTLVGPRDHAASGLTRAVLRGGRYDSVVSLGELAAMAPRHLAAGRRTLVYAYHRDLDITGHVRGVGSDNWRSHLRFVDLLAELVAERLPRDALLAIVGDHGMSTSARSSASTSRTIPSSPPACGCSPGRDAPATSTPPRARPATCSRPGGPSSATRCGWPPASRRSPRAGSGRGCSTGYGHGSATSWRPRADRSASSSGGSTPGRRGWWATTAR